jgi:hypothetical protein
MQERTFSHGYPRGAPGPPGCHPAWPAGPTCGP